MKMHDNCQKCGKYAKLKDGLCRNCREEREKEYSEE